MTKTIALALALTLGCTTFALAKDDDDKITEADMARVTAALDSNRSVAVEKARWISA